MRRSRVIGVEKDRVELTLGDDDLHLVTVESTRTGTKRVQTVMITGRGLRKIAEQAAHHCGYHLELNK